MYKPPHDRLVVHCDAVGRDIRELRRLAGIEVHFPRDAADSPRPYWSGYENFMTTPFGPTPADAIAMLQPLAGLGVDEFSVTFWHIYSAESFVNEVVTAFD